MLFGWQFVQTAFQHTHLLPVMVLRVACVRVACVRVACVRACVPGRL